MRGRIQRALSGFYYVKCTDGQLYTCKARGKLRREGISPLVGDDVEFCEVPGGEGRIDEILPVSYTHLTLPTPSSSGGSPPSQATPALASRAF